MWPSPSATAILVHVVAALESTKGMGEVEYRLEAVVLNKYAQIQSNHWYPRSETALPITVTHDNNRSTNGKKLLQEIILLSDRAEQHNPNTQHQ